MTHWHTLSASVLYAYLGVVGPITHPFLTNRTTSHPSCQRLSVTISFFVYPHPRAMCPPSDSIHSFIHTSQPFLVFLVEWQDGEREVSCLALDVIFFSLFLFVKWRVRRGNVGAGFDGRSDKSTYFDGWPGERGGMVWVWTFEEMCALKKWTFGWV